MKVTIISFSFKRGLPDDPTGNGGGFVFDCRAMPNPFWDETLRGYTGRDRPVADFFARFPEAVGPFIDAAETLVRQAVEQYKRDGRDHLQVAFGCTGGQHRSVYFAERLASRLTDCGGVIVEIEHTAWRHWKVASRPWITISPEITGAFAWIRPQCEESELDSGIGDCVGFVSTALGDYVEIENVRVPQPLESDICRWMSEWYALEERVQDNDDSTTPDYDERKAFDDKGLELTKRLAGLFGHLYRFRYPLAWGYCSGFEESKEKPGWTIVNTKEAQDEEQ